MVTQRPLPGPAFGGAQRASKLLKYSPLVGRVLRHQRET